MNNKKVLTIFGVILVIIIIAVCFVMSNSAKQNLEDAKKDLQETINKYGFVEEEKVDVLVAKFNTEVMDNSLNSLNPASNEYVTIEEDRYYYGLITGIYLIVVPEEFKNDKTIENVEYMSIYVEKDSKFAKDSLEYAKHLIKANNNELTDTEIDKLIKDAKDKAALGSEETAYNGSGILLGYIENEEIIEYQVIRMYE